MKEYLPGSIFNKIHHKLTRLFDSVEDVRRVRELENPLGREAQFYVKEDLDENGSDYPVKRLSEIFNPEEFCKSLKDN